ncbi:MAG: hypothetical protein ACR2HP_07735, partial [Ilumatobacteraceae bacterium]
MGRQRGGGRVPIPFLASAWRRQWGSMVLLALLVALTGAMAMAGVAGARRSASSSTRFDEIANGRDLLVGGADADPAPLAALLDGPLVESYLEQVFVFAQPSFEEDLFTFAPIGTTGLDIEQGVLRAGRRVNPTNPDEVVVNELLATRHDLRPGDVLDLLSLSPVQVTNVFETGAMPESAEGPALALQVVGVARTTIDIAARADEPATLTLSPAFLDRYQGSVGLGTVTHLVRLVDEPDALERFTDAAAAAYPDGELGFDVIQAEEFQSDAIGVATFAVLALGLVVALAGFVWIATTALHQQRLLASETDVLRALGSTPFERVLVLAGAVAPAIAVGAVLAPVVAILLSPLFPVGLARRYDPDVGFHVDAVVLAIGVVGLVVLLGGVVVIAASRLVSAPLDRLPRRRPPRLDRLVRSLRPAPAMGLRFALFSPGTVAVPVRPALGGACLAVIGLTGMAIVGASLGRVVDTPARWGTTWDVAFTRDDPLPVEQSAVLDDPAVAAVSIALIDEQVTIDGIKAVASWIETVRGDISWSMVDGRAPQADDEVVVGQTTLERRGVTLGATVQIASRSSPPLPYRLVGVVVFPSIEFSSPLDDGAGFTQAGGARLGLGDRSRDDAGSLVVLVRWAAGADQSQALERFAAEDFVARPPSPAPAINGLDEMEWVPASADIPPIMLGGIAK